MKVNGIVSQYYNNLATIQSKTDNKANNNQDKVQYNSYNNVTE